MSALRYAVIREDNADDLEDAVNAEITLGWVPLGGVAAYRYTYENDRKGDQESAWVWAQAMTKTESA